MIIQGLLNLIYLLFDKLLVFNIPSLPDEVYSYLEVLFDYLVMAAGIVGNYVHLPYMFTMFGIILAVDAGILIYHFVMWICRKIPVVGIE